VFRSKATYLIFAEGNRSATLLSENGSIGSMPALAVIRVLFSNQARIVDHKKDTQQRILSMLTEEEGGSYMCPLTSGLSTQAQELHLGKWAIASMAGTSSSCLYILLIILTLYTVLLLSVTFISLYV